MERVNERTTAEITVSLYNPAGVLAAPASASYRIDTEAGTVVRAATTIDELAAQLVITLTADDNQIYDDASAPYEVHVVTVTGIYGVDDEVHEEYRYRVKNLAAVTSA